MLAEHYAAAYRNAPSGPEADALAGQARIALRAAADRAATLGSHAQAVAFLTLALEITQEPAERAPLLERAGREATDATPDAARPLFEQAIDLYRSLGDLHGLALKMQLRSGAKVTHCRPCGQGCYQIVLQLAWSDLEVHRPGEPQELELDRRSDVRLH